MPEHFTRNTVQATYWCNKCGKPTLHRVDDRRRGPCLVCMEAPKEKPAQKPAPVQGDLFPRSGS